MNERIKQLAEQAGLKQRVWNSLGKELPMWQEDPDNPGLAKFAELVVKECIEQLVKEGDAWEQFGRNPPQGQETNAGAALFAAYRLKEDAVARLEEHFGVE